jgi:hypothetical protein
MEHAPKRLKSHGLVNPLVEQEEIAEGSPARDENPSDKDDPAPVRSFGSGEPGLQPWRRGEGGDEVADVDHRDAPSLHGYSAPVLASGAGSPVKDLNPRV